MPGLSECVETRPFLILTNNSRSKQNKITPEHPFLDIGKLKPCGKFWQKKL